MRRGFVRLGVAMASSLLVAACSSVGGVIGDSLPAWAGGLPRGTPPRAGAPGYDAYMKSIGAAGQTVTAPPTAEAPSPPPKPSAPAEQAEPVDRPIH